jgi:hypothetical protein
MLKLRLAVLLLLALALVAGCRRSAAPAKVSGTVSYKGQPLKAGNITFHSDKGSYSATIDSDGSYRMSSLPTGTMTVTVDTEFLNPDKKSPGYPGGAGGKAAAVDAERLAAERKMGMPAPPSKEEMAARYVKIPKEHASAKTSKLTVTIEPGKQVKNFDLGN